MKCSNTNYLKSLEQLADSSDPADYYLWPRTPVNDLQGEILQRVGVTDWGGENPPVCMK